MAANMQHMMMPPGQQQGQQHQMRGAPMGLRERVFQSIIGQPVPQGGWHANYPPQDRFNRTISLYARPFPGRFCVSRRASRVPCEAVY